MIRAAALALVAMAAVAARADGLDSVRGDYRPLLLFAPAPDDAELSRQTTMLADAADGLAERRVAVYVVERDRVFTTFGAPAPEADAEALRRRLRVPDDRFRVVLVGLDGGVALTRDAPIPPRKLFAAIDAPALRRRELREPGRDRGRDR